MKAALGAGGELGKGGASTQGSKCWRLKCLNEREKKKNKTRTHALTHTQTENLPKKN